MTDTVKTRKNRTGAISYIAQSNKWRARMMINGKYKHLGMYESELQARAALDDLIFNIANGQYIDPAQTRRAQTRRAQTQARDDEKAAARAVRIDRAYRNWLNSSPRPDFD